MSSASQVKHSAVLPVVTERCCVISWLWLCHSYRPTRPRGRRDAHSRRRAGTSDYYRVASDGLLIASSSYLLYARARAYHRH